MTTRFNLSELLARQSGHHSSSRRPAQTGLEALKKAEGFTPGDEPVDLVSYLEGYLKTAHPCSLLSFREACALLGLGRSTLYAKIKDSPTNKYYDPEFPKPISYSDSGTAVFFAERELVVWMLGRVMKRQEVQ